MVAEASIDAFLCKGNIWNMDPADDDFSVQDYDWNDHYAWVGLVRRANVSVEATYASETRELSDVRLGEVTIQIHAGE